MIPHGRPTLDLDAVAARAETSPSTWKRTRHAAFSKAVKPLRGMLRPLLYDAAQVDAYLAGQPIPALPKGPSPADLLTDTEAAAIIGVTASTVRADAATGRMDGGVERHGRRWWTRAAAEAEAARPDQRGRQLGAKDKAPRARRPDPRIPEVGAELEAADAGRRGPVTAAELAARYAVSTRTAERIMSKAREARR